MAKAKRVKQLNITMPNKAGLLSEISSAIAGAKVDISAICAYEMDRKAYFMAVTESNAKTKKALAPLKAVIEEEDVVMVELPNKVGSLQQVAKKIADAGIDIIYIYATAGTGKLSYCVFKSVDDKKAIRVLNK